jgi:hypothetical protein
MTRNPQLCELIEQVIVPALLRRLLTQHAAAPADRSPNPRVESRASA